MNQICSKNTPGTFGYAPAYLPNVVTLAAAAMNPAVAMANDFTRSVQGNPGVLVNPVAYMQACGHAWMVGCASAVWSFSAITQPVGVTAGLIPRGR